MRHPGQSEGRQVRGLRQERQQQRQEPPVRHLLRVVSHQGRRTLTFCVHPSQVSPSCGGQWSSNRWLLVVLFPHYCDFLLTNIHFYSFTFFVTDGVF